MSIQYAYLQHLLFFVFTANAKYNNLAFWSLNLNCILLKYRLCFFKKNSQTGGQMSLRLVVTILYGFESVFTCFAHVGQLVSIIAAIVITVACPRQWHAFPISASVLSQCTFDMRYWPSSGGRNQWFVNGNCNQTITMILHCVVMQVITIFKTRLGLKLKLI